MNYLLDTHAFLWLLISPGKLSSKAKKIINSEAQVYISTVSFWEVSLKYSLGKISIKGVSPELLPIYAKRSGFKTSNINSKIASSFFKLPILTHKDPFDRMLVWQAINENLALISKDKQLSEYEKYGLKLIW